ncbi:hypothetical protein FM076_04430 [Streptomyces albus subsp. chlorinus]|nr:hypothetical protein [Streptomyces albus subsp. chlorinus]
MPQPYRPSPLSRTHARQAARRAADGLADVLHPLLVLGRGAPRLLARCRDWWRRTPGERRGPTLFAVAACGVLLWLLPYGPALATLCLLAATAWYGRDGASASAAAGAKAGERERARLQALYEALVPCLAPAGDPSPEPLYVPGGTWEQAFEEYAFRDGRISELLLRYPAWFPDGHLTERLRVEQLLAAKTGRGREYRFCWDQESNLLEMTALEPLPTDIPAQPFATAPGETVLGFTDGYEVRGTVPVRLLDPHASPRHLPPVLWRTGHRPAEPHLLAVGLPGAGTSTLLRSLALQALRDGDVLFVDGEGGGEFAGFAARRGVLGVETTLPGALDALEWAARETERRLTAAGRARQRGEDPPAGARRPLWVLVDRPAALSHLARVHGATDPQELLRTPLRHGRAAGVTVVVAEQFGSDEELADPVLACTRARVVLGAVSPQEAGTVLGAAPQTGPPRDAPRGRGFARLGCGPVLRLQVPVTPDPLDGTAPEAARTAVRELLPESVRAPAPSASAAEGQVPVTEGQVPVTGAPQAT